MSLLSEKSLKTLELPRVLEMLAAFAYSEEAKEKSLTMRPAESLADAQFYQRQTSAAKKLMGIRPAPSFSGLKRVGNSLQRAELGGVLNTRELLNISGVLRVARIIKDYSSGEGLLTCLENLFKMLGGNKYLEDKISGCILSEDEIADNASPELASIRRHKRASGNKIRETLQKYITSPSYTKYLQDLIITQRGDRFVVPVKAEHRNDIPGMVHDVSSSGATLFVEPLAVVQLNNELREMAVKEQREIERILAELSSECASFGDGILRDYDALVALDCVFARGKLSYEMDAQEPVLNQNGVLSLNKAYHPLLEKGNAVPISVHLGGDFDTLVITGPNTGGKTVTLKTIGILSLMAACGLHVPASSGSVVPVWDAVYADIGDEQSIEQSLSTFSSHMSNIVSILDEAGDGSLVLFDELGAGTDPVEGAALAVAILQRARSNGAKVAATTHYAELKSFALTTVGVENASCEFDVETLRPTYRLLIGIPGKSNAFAISKRLGLDESIIEAAKGQINTQSAAFEDVISKLEAQRQIVEKERIQLEFARLETEENRRVSDEIRAQLEKEREKSAERARAEARQIIVEARTTADDILRELGRMRAQMPTNEEMTGLRQKLNKAEDKLGSGMKPQVEASPPSRPLVVGDTVEIISAGTKATVLAALDKEGSVSLQAGIMKITAKASDVRLVEEQKVKMPKMEQIHVSRPSSVKTECDLRGQMAEEAVLSMELFLDTAVMAGLHSVSVIHGKGTGALRAAVHKALRQNKQVKSFRLGRYGEGEAGVTIVELK